MQKKSKALFKPAKQFIPGGVNSPVRAGIAVGIDAVVLLKSEGFMPETTTLKEVELDKPKFEIRVKAKDGSKKLYGGRRDENGNVYFIKDEAKSVIFAVHTASIDKIKDMAQILK